MYEEQIEIRKCDYCGQIRSTKMITSDLFLCPICYNRYRLSKIDVDKISETIDDEVKEKPYLKKSKEWCIGHTRKRPYKYCGDINEM